MNLALSRCSGRKIYRKALLFFPLQGRMASAGRAGVATRLARLLVAVLLLALGRRANPAKE